MRSIQELRGRSDSGVWYAGFTVHNLFRQVVELIRSSCQGSKGGPQPKIEISETEACWRWHCTPQCVEYDVPDFLALEVSFLVRNPGSPVSIAVEQATIPGVGHSSRKVEKLVDPAHQAEVRFGWIMYQEGTGELWNTQGMDEEIRAWDELPRKPSQGNLTLTDSLGNEYQYSFHVPGAPPETDHPRPLF